MDIILIKEWFLGNMLTVAALVVTIAFIYHYMIEKKHGANLSKKYRDSIYEAQTKIFLNATQYLISGNKELAIKEFLNAVDLNRETIDLYFALGGLFRSNGEIDKAIGIHRSLIARENISEPMRLKALKELAIDFDKGGFVDKAIETYRDVLKVNRDQHDVILSLCRIFEDTEDWDSAYNYRLMLSKVGQENQAETISHILVQKAKAHFEQGKYKECHDELDDAFRFAPSVSAKILLIKISLVEGRLEDAKGTLLELLKEHPIYASFVFVSLDEFSNTSDKSEMYRLRLNELKDYFLKIDDADLLSAASVILTKIRLLKSLNRKEEANEILTVWMQNVRPHSDVLKVEFIKLLIEIGNEKEAIKQMEGLLNSLHSSLTRHYCSNCGYNSDEIFWRCPQCHKWETIQFRWKV